MRPVHIYSVLTTEASFNPADYKETQCPSSPFIPRWPRDECPSIKGSATAWHLMRHLYHTRSRLQWWAISPYSWTGWPSMVWGACSRQLGTPVYSPNTQQPHPHNPIKWRNYGYRHPRDIPDLINAPEELLPDFDSWPHCVLEYQW